MFGTTSFCGLAWTVRSLVITHIHARPRWLVLLVSVPDLQPLSAGWWTGWGWIGGREAAPGKPDRSVRRSKRTQTCSSVSRSKEPWSHLGGVTASRRCRPSSGSRARSPLLAGRSAPTLRCLSGLRVGARNDACVCAGRGRGGGLFFHTHTHTTSVIASILGLTVHLQGAAARPCARTLSCAHQGPQLPRCKGASSCWWQQPVLECDAGGRGGGLPAGTRLLSSVCVNSVCTEAAADVCCVTG